MADRCGTKAEAARTRRRRAAGLGLAAVVGAGLAAAAWNAARAAAAERRHPPEGRFLEIGGVRLHYVERGSGPPLVLVHGNGSMIADFETSGLVARAARGRRVIAFDRPGFGHSDRPGPGLWTAERQAALLLAALDRLGATPATVLGHSWGAAVALAMALRRPEAVRGLVLASGYYFPTARPDAVALGAPRLPVVGDAMRHTVSPLLGRLLWGRLMRRIFAPTPEPAAFRAGFSREMALRPSQLRAAAEESALLVPTAAGLSRRAAELAPPVVIVAGAGDRLVDPESQAVRLHRALPGSRLRLVAGAGHMVHQTDPEAVLAAIETVEAA